MLVERQFADIHLPIIFALKAMLSICTEISGAVII